MPGAIAEAAQIASARPPLPALPEDCRKWQKSGAARDTPADEAVKLYDLALEAQNHRTTRCAAWHDRIRKAHGDAQ